MPAGGVCPRWSRLRAARNAVSGQAFQRLLVVCGLLLLGQPGVCERRVASLAQIVPFEPAHRVPGIGGVVDVLTVGFHDYSSYLVI